MIGKILSPFLNPAIEKTAAIAQEHKFTHNQVVYLSLGLAGAIFLFLVSGLYALALLGVLGQRLSIGVAKRLNDAEGEEKQYGDYMRLFSDYIFFGGFLFFFMMAQDGASIPGAFLFFAFYINEACDYAYAQSFNDKDLNPKGANKALLSLVDHSMVTAFFILMCLLPVGFPFFAVILGFMCFASAIGRFMEIRLNHAGLLDPLEDDEEDEEMQEAPKEEKKEEKPKRKKSAKKKGDDLPDVIEDR